MFSKRFICVAFVLVFCFTCLFCSFASAQSKFYDAKDHNDLRTAYVLTESDFGIEHKFTARWTNSVYFTYKAETDTTLYITVTSHQDSRYGLRFVDNMGKDIGEEYQIPYGDGKTMIQKHLNANEKCIFKLYFRVVCPASAETYISFCSEGHHKLGSNSEVTKNATCTENGTVVWRCELCNEIGQTQEIPANGHTPGEEEILLEATCLQAGLKGIKCLTCGEVLSSEPIPKVDHTYGVFTTVKEATCTGEGKNEQHCTVCNATLATESVPALGHTYGSWVDVKPATCTEAGERAQRCAVCGETLNSETVEAFGHSPMEWEVVREAKCDGNGLREKKCAICGAVLESEEIEALGHSYTEWETTIEPTKKEEGEKIRHCIHCGDTQIEKIKKLPLFGDF